jgi:lycopene beta-cyclase
MQNTDILILGAGCAGLSLAVHLLQRGVTRPMIIIDRRQKFERDRTWCFWATEDHPFQSCVSYSWPRWKVESDSSKAVCETRLFPYQHIAADDFYRYALDILEEAPNVTLRLGETVSVCHEEADSVLVCTNHGRYKARQVFDSRPGGIPGGDYLRQHFGGQLIETTEPVFDPETVVLMSFVPRATPGLHFIYVLPFSETRALVESTWMSPEVHRHRVYDDAVEDYIRVNYPDTTWTVQYREYGVIPMTTDGFSRGSGKLTRIGLAAGLARPSTGYAFTAIQRHAAALAEKIAQDGTPLDPSYVFSAWSPWQKFLDRVFLTYLRNHGARGADVFLRLFQNNPADRLVRFLAGTSNLHEDLRVMSAMPKLPFIRAALTG